MQPTNYVTDVDDLFERMSRNFGIHGPLLSDADFPVDVVRHEDELVVTADVPGFEAESFDVAVDDDLLTIRADSETETEDVDDDAYVRRERRHRSLRRTIRLPVSVDGDDAAAAYANGVLTVTIPVVTADAVHRIDVE